MAAGLQKTVHMKRQTKKLTLRTEAIRNLNVSELANVNGGNQSDSNGLPCCPFAMKPQLFVYAGSHAGHCMPSVITNPNNNYAINPMICCGIM